MKKKGKVVICIPAYPFRPHQATLEAIKAEVPFLDESEFDHGISSEIGNPYISAARATMLRKALDAKADVIFFLDSDLSWPAGSLLKVVRAEGDVVAGTYRFKRGDPGDLLGKGAPEGDEAWYMGNYAPDPFGRPQVRADGAIKMHEVPAGFLKVTRRAINVFMDKFPELLYGEKCSPHVDLFNHGAHKGAWWGEDFSFSRRWREECGGEIWCVPDLDIDHNGGGDAASSTSAETTCFKGNFHKYLLACPGGSDSDKPVSPQELKDSVAVALTPQHAASRSRRAS